MTDEKFAAVRAVAFTRSISKKVSRAASAACVTQTSLILPQGIGAVRDVLLQACVQVAAICASGAQTGGHNSDSKARFWRYISAKTATLDRRMAGLTGL